MGRYCCVVGCSSRSHDRKGQKLDNQLSFFRLPTIIEREGPKVKDVTTRRRQAWVAAIRRKTITFEKSSREMVVCSLHFHTGAPSYVMDESHPDWAPSLHMMDLKAYNYRHNKKEVSDDTNIQLTGKAADLIEECLPDFTHSLRMDNVSQSVQGEDENQGLRRTGRKRTQTAKAAKAAEKARAQSAKTKTKTSVSTQGPGKRKGGTKTQSAKNKTKRQGGKGTGKTGVPSVKLEPEDSEETAEPPGIDITVSADVYSSWRTVGVIEGLTSDERIAQFLVALYTRKAGVRASCAACRCPLTLYCTACQGPSPLTLLPAAPSPSSATHPPPPSLPSTPTAHSSTLSMPSTLTAHSSTLSMPSTLTAHSSTLSMPSTLTTHPFPSSFLSSTSTTHPPHPSSSMSSPAGQPRPVMMYRSSEVAATATVTSDLSSAQSQQHTGDGEARPEQDDATLVKIKLEPEEEEEDGCVGSSSRTGKDADIGDLPVSFFASVNQDSSFSVGESETTTVDKAALSSTQSTLPLGQGEGVKTEPGDDEERSDVGKRKSSSAVDASCASQAKSRKVTKDGSSEADTCAEGAQKNPDEGCVITADMRRLALIHTYDRKFYKQRKMELESKVEYVTVKVSNNVYKMTKEAFEAQFRGATEGLVYITEISEESVLSDKVSRHPVRILISGNLVPAFHPDGEHPLPLYLYTHYECLHCKKTFSRKKDFNKHVQIHLPKFQYKCILCSKTFVNPYSLRYHGRMHELQCKVCGKYNSDQTDYDNHMKLHTENNGVIKCHQCPYKTTDYNKFVRHKRECGSVKTLLQCKTCGVFLKSRQGLKYHILAIHKQERAHKCTKCNRSFVFKKCLASHMRFNHSRDGRRFSCEKCGKRFIEPKHLTRHLQGVHDGERPFKCTHCPAMLSTSSSLKIHLRRHTGEKPIKCTQCTKAFAHLAGFNLHMKNHHGQKAAKLNKPVDAETESCP